ncbi:MAG: HEAT repeat domain-containing protein [Candidatus Aminicenantaceae bacterium]
MSISLIIVGYSVAFLLAFSLALILFIIHLRIIRGAHERKLDQISEDLETDILMAMSAKEDDKALEVAKKYSIYPTVLIRVLTEYMHTISGSERDRLRLIYTHGLQERLLLDIDSRFTYIRLRAICPFVMFAKEEDFPLIMQLIQEKPVIRLAVIDGLSSIPHPSVISRLFKAFAESPATDLMAYMNVMHSIGRRIEDQVGQYLQEPLPAAKLGVLIELVGALPFPQLYMHVLGFSNHADKEVRIRVARALGQLNILTKDVQNTMFKLAGDEAWEVQAQAFKSIGRLRIEAGIGPLENGLFSSQWHCRRNAAIALSSLGQKGKQLLKKTSEQSEDPYASDMARMILEETEYFQAT